MSGTLNKVMLIGHLGDDVKMHYFEGGNSIGRFPLATNETYVNRQTGERVTNTEWHNIVVRNKAAEVCEKYLSKGDKIYVEGRIKQDNGRVKTATPGTLQKYRLRISLSCLPKRKAVIIISLRQTSPLRRTTGLPLLIPRPPHRRGSRKRMTIYRFNEV